MKHPGLYVTKIIFRKNTSITSNTSTHHHRYVLAARDIFELSRSSEYRHLQVYTSFFEIYGNGIFDLLNNRNKLRCMENHSKEVCVVGLTERRVQSVEDLLRVMDKGKRGCVKLVAQQQISIRADRTRFFRSR